MNKIKIFSSSPCVVETQNEQKYIDSNYHIELLDVLCPAILKVYSTNNDFLPYTITIVNANGTYSISNDECKIANLYNGAVVFLCAESTPIFKQIANENLTIKQTKINISAMENCVVLSSNRDYKIVNVKCNDIKCITLDKYLIVKCFDKKNSLIVYNTQNLEVKTFKFSSIEQTETEFKICENFNDMFSHAKITNYDLLDFTEKSNEVYVDKSKLKISTNYLINICSFFDCLRASDYKNAKMFISSSLQNSLSDENLKSYFSPFDNYFIDADDKCLVFTLSKNELKKYTIRIENNLIDEIYT